MTKKSKKKLEDVGIDSSKSEDSILTEISEEEELDINEIKEILIRPVKASMKEMIGELIEKISFDSIMFSSISETPIVDLEITSDGDSIENIALNGKTIKVPEDYKKFTSIQILGLINDSGNTTKKIVEELRSEERSNLKNIDGLKGGKTNE